MSNPPDLSGNDITSAHTQTVTCGNSPLQITAGIPSYNIARIIRNNVLETNGTTAAYPDGSVPLVFAYQWQQSLDLGVTWTNIPGATNQNYSPSPLTIIGTTEFRRVINGDACESITDTLGFTIVYVNPIISTIGNNGPLCSGTGHTLNLTTGAQANGKYFWSGPASFSSSLQNPTISNVTTANAGVYSLYVQDTLNGCYSDTALDTVVIYASGTAAAGTGVSGATVCSGNTLNLTSTPTGGTSPYTYSWAGPGAFTSTSQNPNRAAITTAQAGL